MTPLIAPCLPTTWVVGLIRAYQYAYLAYMPRKSEHEEARGRVVLGHHRITSWSKVHGRLDSRWTESLQKLTELKNALEGLQILRNVWDIFPSVFLITTKVFWNSSEAGVNKWKKLQSVNSWMRLTGKRAELQFLCAGSLLNYLMQLLLFFSSMCRQALRRSAETIFWEEFWRSW